MYLIQQKGSLQTEKQISIILLMNVTVDVIIEG